ncbi:hypothetical protein V8G54_013870 [Vigna mungo]|uniref:Uncharacterized protein n=1 Tax=Vigna mungo TaxID=3915 RepID=A0AAQ3NI14_VIGMU
MEVVCGSGVCVSSLPRSSTLTKSTVPQFRVSYQHLTPFPSQSHLFSYHPPPYAKTLRATTTTKPAIFLPHLVASLVGEIISRFEKKGFKLTGLKLFQCSKELAEVCASLCKCHVLGHCFFLSFYCYYYRVQVGKEERRDRRLNDILSN